MLLKSIRNNYIICGNQIAFNMAIPITRKKNAGFSFQASRIQKNAPVEQSEL